MTALASTASSTSSPRKPPSPYTTAKKTSPSHSQDIHGAPAAVYEYGSVVAQRCVERISSPVLTCHHMSGSTLNDRTTEKAAPTSNAPSIAGKEHNQRNSWPMLPAYATPAPGAALTSEPASRAPATIALLCAGLAESPLRIAMFASLIFALIINSYRGCDNSPACKPSPRTLLQTAGVIFWIQLGAYSAACQQGYRTSNSKLRALVLAAL